MQHIAIYHNNPGIVVNRTSLSLKVVAIRISCALCGFTYSSTGTCTVGTDRYHATEDDDDYDATGRMKCHTVISSIHTTRHA